MKHAIDSTWLGIRRLFRFLFWYAVVAAGMLYLLPTAGLFLENSYDAMGRAARLIAVIGFIVVVVAWQLFSARERWRRSTARKKTA